MTAIHQAAATPAELAASTASIPTTPGGWPTLLIDPPWRFENTAARGAVPYLTLSDEEIARLPISLITAPRAHLYLWTTDAHLELALSCVRAWGFQFKHPFVWVKTSSDGGLRIGNGNYGRKAHELMLFAVRGALPVLHHDVPTVFHAPPRGHSRKPLTSHEIAERLSPSPRLEMFARARRLGWTSWGDQCPAEPEPIDVSNPRARFTAWIEHQALELGHAPSEAECRETRQRFEREARTGRAS